MTKINDGGTAFPVMWRTMAPELGMSLRDYFAAHAEIGNLEFKNAEELSKFTGIAIPGDPTLTDILRVAAKMRYLYADAMLKAREEAK